jgi:hypothetical protein
MTEKFSQIPQKPLPHSANSRYTLPVDIYAKAPLWRLFHFVAASLRTDTTSNPIICNNLHTLISRAKTTHALSTTSTLFKKHTGVYPTHFESPVPVPCRRRSPRHPVAAIASQIAGLSTESWRDRSAHSGRELESASRNQNCRNGRPWILTCNKKAISPTLTGNAVAACAVYTVIQSKRINLQETDR